MLLEYLLFFMYLIPTVIGIAYKIKYSDDEILTKRKEKITKKGKEKYLFQMSMLYIIFLIPYFGAFYYADLKYIWLLLAIIYSTLAIFSITASAYCWYQKAYNNEEYTKTMNKIHNDNNKNQYYWSKFRARFNCVIKIFAILLWVYSWRHLVA